MKKTSSVYLLSLTVAVLAAFPVQRLMAYACNAVNVPYHCVVAQQQPINLPPWTCMKTSNGEGEQCITDENAELAMTSCINVQFESGCIYEVWASCGVNNAPDGPKTQVNAAYQTSIAFGDCPEAH